MKLTDRFRKIDLAQTDHASLMNRTDEKCWLPVRMLPEILEEVFCSYDLLSVDGACVQDYYTAYYDTPFDEFYLSHHNGKRNRVKVRKRNYLLSDRCFIEIKRKCNKGRTDKVRREIPSINPWLVQEEQDFVHSYINCDPADLDQKMECSFQRLTLVNTTRKERCTIDVGVCFQNSDCRTGIPGISIMELKQEDRRSGSVLGATLKRRKIPIRGFSKYCIGRVLLQPELKHNRLKPTLRSLQKYT